MRKCVLRVGITSLNYDVDEALAVALVKEGAISRCSGCSDAETSVYHLTGFDMYDDAEQKRRIKKLLDGSRGRVLFEVL